MTTQTEWPEDRVKELLAQVELASGHHNNGQQASAMDLIGMAIEGEWTATPECVHPILARRVHRINDHPMTDAAGKRRIVIEAGPLLVGTAEMNTARAVIVSHRAGLTVGGLVDALKTTPEVETLSGAYLAGADLSRADLPRADLFGAYLSRAYLSGAYLAGADLSGAYLAGADLSRADLSGADLSRADLFGADFFGADFSGAYLAGANLSGADLSGADLAGADLFGVNLTGVKHDDATVWPEGFDVEAATT